MKEHPACVNSDERIHLQNWQRFAELLRARPIFEVRKASRTLGSASLFGAYSGRVGGLGIVLHLTESQAISRVCGFEYHSPLDGVSKAKSLFSAKFQGLFLDPTIAYSVCSIEVLVT